MSIIINIFLILSLISVSSCYQTTDYHIDRKNFSQDCQGLRTKLNNLKQRKSQIRENDKFMFRYMMIIPALTATFKMNKAEKQLDNEIGNARDALNSQNCNNNYSNHRNNYNSNTSHNNTNLQNNNNSQYNNPYLSNNYNQMNYYNFNRNQLSPQKNTVKKTSATETITSTINYDDSEIDLGNMLNKGDPMSRYKQLLNDPNMMNPSSW